MIVDQNVNLDLAAGSADRSGPNLSRLIRLPEVMKRVGISRSAIYKRMAEGRFPRSRSLGPKCAVWLEADIDQWIGEVLNRSA